MAPRCGLHDGCLVISDLVAICPCGRSWTLEAWLTLPLVWIEGQAEKLEMRKCSPCRRTIAVEIESVDADGVRFYKILD